MAQKKITELQLISSITDALNFPGDNGSQSYRATALQIKNYILTAAGITRDLLGVGAVARKNVVTKTANYTVDPATDNIILADASGGDFTITMPAASADNKGFSVKIISIDTGVVEVDLLGGVTFDIGLADQCVNVDGDGSKWRLTNFNRPSESIISMVRVHTNNGLGSTDNKIRRWATTVVNVGDSISYAEASSTGGVFTINDDGIYSIVYNDTSSSAGLLIGISLNSTQLTTSIGSITTADRLSANYNSQADGIACASWTGKLSANDVIRAHTNGNANGNTLAVSNFTITRLK